MAVIDAHTHILPPEIIAARADYMARDKWFGTLHASPRSRFAQAQDLIDSMDEAGIDASVIFGFAFADTLICRICNDYVLDASSLWPDRLIPFAVVNPCDGDLALEEAQRCLEAGARGIGELMPDGQAFNLSAPCLTELLLLAQTSSVPVMIHVNEPVGHTYAGKGMTGPAEAYRLADQWPEIRFIFSHWGGGLPFYELMPSAQETLHNTFYDTAASLYLYQDRIFAEVSRWAPDKILFGTDYPLIGQSRFLYRLRQLGLDAQVLDDILYCNLARVLGLADMPGGS